jgi:DNA-directed RNA polymerase subunit beta'
MIIGLFHMTTLKEGAKGEGSAYGSIAEAQLAFDAGFLDLNAKVKIRLPLKAVEGESVIRETTMGRALFNESLPQEFPYQEKRVGKKEIGRIVTDLVDTVSRVEVAQSLDRIKDLGFYWATRSGVSMSISDANFDTSGSFDKARAKILLDGEKEHTRFRRLSTTV